MLCLQFCKQWLLALLNIQEVCVKSLLFLVSLCKRMIKQLLNMVLAKYRDLLVVRGSIIDLLATDKS